MTRAGPHWAQVLCTVGGIPLLMCVDNNGVSCLFIAAQNGHAAVAEVWVGGGRQREAGGRVSAATASGAGAVGSTLQHAVAV